jgi:hypothetical protein
MKKNGILFVLVLVLTITAISCGSGSSGSSPSDAVETLFKHIKAKDYDKAMTLFYFEEGEEMSEADMQKMKALLMAENEEYEKKGGLKDIEIVEESVDSDGTSGEVDFKIIYGNGDEDKRNYDTKKVNGKWKLEM